MSYEIKFKDRTQASITVSTERGENLKEAWFDTSKHKMPVDIDGDGYILGEIKAINRVPDPVIQIPDFNQQTISAGKKCLGTYSIQREINQIIKSTYPKNWAKRISDQATRDKIRDKLKSMPGVLWCDYKTGECGC